MDDLSIDSDPDRVFDIANALRTTQVKAFTQSFLIGLSNTTGDATFSEIGKDVVQRRKSSSDAIREARVHLGKTNEKYLQFSVMMLWGGERDDEYLLYPKSTGSGSPMDVATEQTMRAMLTQARDELKTTKEKLERARMHVAYYIAIPEVRASVRYTLFENRLNKKRIAAAVKINNHEFQNEGSTREIFNIDLERVDREQSYFNTIDKWFKHPYTKNGFMEIYADGTPGIETGLWYDLFKGDSETFREVCNVLMMLCVPSATRALNELFGLESAAASYDPCVDDLTTVMGGLGVAEKKYVPSHRCDEVEVADVVHNMAKTTFEQLIQSADKSDGTSENLSLSTPHNAISSTHNRTKNCTKDQFRTADGELASAFAFLKDSLSSFSDIPDDDQDGFFFSAISKITDKKSYETSQRLKRLAPLFDQELVRAGRATVSEFVDYFEGEERLRQLLSLTIALSRGGVCSLPPHKILLEEKFDFYTCPVPLPSDADDIENDKILTFEDSGSAQWFLADANIRLLNNIHDLHRAKWDRIMNLDEDADEDENTPIHTSKTWDLNAKDAAPQGFLRVIWTPSVLNSNVPILRVGNVSASPLSLAVSYTTILRAFTKAMVGGTNKTSVHVSTSVYMAALLKLESLQSLRLINRALKKGLVVQDVISGGRGVQEQLDTPNNPLNPYVWPKKASFLENRVKQYLNNASNSPATVAAQSSNALAGVAKFDLFMCLTSRPIDPPTSAASRVIPLRIVADGDIDRDHIISTTYSANSEGASVTSKYIDNESKDVEAIPRPTETINDVPAFACPDDLRACIQTLLHFEFNGELDGISEVTMSGLEILKRREAALRRSYSETIARGREQYSRGSTGPEDKPIYTSRKRPADAEERVRRNAIWTDALRELDLCGDNLYSFLKDMAGTLHEDVTALIELEDRSMEANQRMYREQRRETLREINRFSQRVMDTAIASVFRQSKLKADLDAGLTSGNSADDAVNAMGDSVVVMSEESSQRIRELADGTAGLGFLEANSALQQFLKTQQGSPTTLRAFVLGLRGTLDAYRDYAIDALQANQSESGRASLEYLANPRNSYIVRLKNETFAAIRSAYMMLRRQLLSVGIRENNIPSAYSCMEGSNLALRNQFAQLCAYQLCHSRAFSSSASMYLGATAARMNLNMLNISLNKMVNRVYSTNHNRPM
jgi:hypothetical protein